MMRRYHSSVGETRDQCKEEDEEDLLYTAVLNEVIDTAMLSFTDTDHGVSTEKLKYAPITNLGCEKVNVLLH